MQKRPSRTGTTDRLATSRPGSVLPFEVDGSPENAPQSSAVTYAPAVEFVVVRLTSTASASAGTPVTTWVTDPSAALPDWRVSSTRAGPAGVNPSRPPASKRPCTSL